MGSEQKEIGEGMTLKIAGSFSIYDAAAHREALFAALTAHDDVVVDLNGVETCDVAGIQLLCSAQKMAADKGKRLSITAAPPSVVDVMDEMGIHSMELLNSDS